MKTAVILKKKSGVGKAVNIHCVHITNMVH